MRQRVALFAAAAIVAATLPLVREHDEELVSLLHKAKIAVTDGKSQEKKSKGPPPLANIELQHLDDRREVVTAPGDGQRTAELTLDPLYQRAAESILRRGQIHEGAIVMSDVRSGQVLAWASYNHGRPQDLASKANWPSASVFKVVTGSALVEAGISLNEEFCYASGGEGGITRRHLEVDERRDKYCASLGMALGRSINPVFARLAHQHLKPDTLQGVATRLGWTLNIPFDVPIEPSQLDIPTDDELEFARTAAGFWHTTLSPFQGMNLAQTIANKGEMIRSFIVDRVLDEDEQVLYERPKERTVFKRVLDERTAWAVTRLMEKTVSDGSSFKTWHDRAGRPFLPDIPVAGKTGTLARKENGSETLITWWVGFAPSDKPEIAISAVVTNRGPWRIKGTHAASDMMRVYFADTGRKGVHYPPGVRERRKRKKPDEAKTASR